ncbi:MAG: hypothetical protein ABI619_01965 [Betaproteobacteria bacterium]
MESYLDGSMLDGLERRAEQELTEDLQGLNVEEAAVLALLQQRLQRPPVKAGKPAARLQRPPATGRRTAAMPPRTPSAL